MHLELGKVFLVAAHERHLVGRVTVIVLGALKCHRNKGTDLAYHHVAEGIKLSVCANRLSVNALDDVTGLHGSLSAITDQLRRQHGFISSNSKFKRWGMRGQIMLWWGNVNMHRGIFPSRGGAQDKRSRLELHAHRFISFRGNEGKSGEGGPDLSAERPLMMSLT